MNLEIDLVRREALILRVASNLDKDELLDLIEEKSNDIWQLAKAHDKIVDRDNRFFIEIKRQYDPEFELEVSKEIHDW